MTEPLIQKVDCVRLYVSNHDSGLSFYRDQLGLELIWRTKYAIGLKMPNDITEIVLHTEKKRPEIDLKVKSADDAAVQIEEAGGKIVVPPFDIQIGRFNGIYYKFPYLAVVIEHELADGPVLYSSYIHVADVLVQTVDYVDENTPRPAAIKN